MTPENARQRRGSYFVVTGVRALTVLLVANMVVLSAEQERDREKDKNRDRERKVEPARKAPAPAPPAAAPPARFQGGPVERRGPGPEVFRTREGGEIHRTQGGVVSEVHTPAGEVIRHSPSGVRQIEIVRPGGRVIVANGAGRTGYVQRPLVYHGQTFAQRTYVMNGVTYARVYRPWSYGGREYHVYAPLHYYRPSFYTWAYTPWARPVYYRWGWGGRPWFAYYGGYFTPYPSYVSPAFWLTDFLIASTLESAYVAQTSYSGTPYVAYNSSATLSPDVKQEIADEVRRQMDQERMNQAAAQNGMPSGPPPLFSPAGPRIFMVANGVMAYAGSMECPLSEGDVIGLTEAPSPGAEWAQVRVLASRGSSCPRGSILNVRTLDLQEMQNHMQATLDLGMDKLQSDQGSNGMPMLPPGTGGTVNAPYANDVQPDDKALDDLSLAAQNGGQTEQSILGQGAQQTPASEGSGATITLGMTPSQVMNILGQPRNTVDLGTKKIFIYSNMKITFLNDRVSDVQ